MVHSRLTCLCLVLIVLPFWASADFYDESWMDPVGWSEDHNNNKECCKCGEVLDLPPTGAQQKHLETSKFTEDGVALMYLRRWMTQLFDRKNLMHDRQLQTYVRTVTLTVSASQLDKIEKWKDPRDLDEVMTEIFVNAHKNKPHMGCDGHYHTAGTGFKVLVFDIFIDLFKLTRTSEIRFLLMAVLVVICGWFIHKRYHISYLTLVAGGLFLFGYLHTYLECNRELEVNEMMEALHSAENKKQSGFLSYLSKLFSTSNSNDEKELHMLKKSTKIKLGFCRPDHVFIMYFNDMFMKYLQVLLEQCTGTLQLLQGSLPWPFNWFAGAMLIGMICYLVKLTFKYILSPAAWSHMWQRNAQHIPYINQTAALTQGDGSIHNVDRISGDNLKSLLGILNSTSQLNRPTVPEVSGVEEVREAIESVPANDTSTSSVSNSDTSVSSSSKVKKNNNDPLKEHITKFNDVKMEDLPDDT